MAYVKVPIPSVVYHLTKKVNLDSILEDGKIRRFGDTECWFCESLDKMKAFMEQTVMREGAPYFAVGGYLCYYPKFVPEDYAILKLTPCRREDEWYQWNQELPSNCSKEQVKAAQGFSQLKIGYRGDLAFKNAEIIDVPHFLIGQIVLQKGICSSRTVKELLKAHPNECFQFMTPSGFIDLTPSETVKLLRGEAVLEDPGASKYAMPVPAEEVLKLEIKSVEQGEDGCWYVLTDYGVPRLELSDQEQEQQMTM